jgi:hypothetical protein
MIQILDITLKTCCEAISFPKLVMKLHKLVTMMTGIKHSGQWLYGVQVTLVVIPRQEAIQCDGCEKLQHRTCGTLISRDLYGQVLIIKTDLDLILRPLHATVQYRKHYLR